jgi:hypothetical protein
MSQTDHIQTYRTNQMCLSVRSVLDKVLPRLVLNAACKQQFAVRITFNKVSNPSSLTSKMLSL